MIDRGDIRQAIDRCSNIWASPRAPFMVSSSIRRQPDCKIQAGEQSERLMYEQSHRDYLRSGYTSQYLYHETASLPSAVTYKAQRDKNARELKLANAAITDMQMRQRVAALDAKYTKVSWC